MSIKTFKSASSAGRTLEVTTYGRGANLYIRDQGHKLGISIGSSDVPALCLAILEAAGVEAKHHSVYENGNRDALEHIAQSLKDEVEISEADAKEAADRAVLEADAWTLYESAFPDDHPYPNLERFPEHLRDAWIRVALKAREMKCAGNE